MNIEDTTLIEFLRQRNFGITNYNPDNSSSEDLNTSSELIVVDLTRPLQIGELSAAVGEFYLRCGYCININHVPPDAFESVRPDIPHLPCRQAIKARRDQELAVLLVYHDDTKAFVYAGSTLDISRVILDEEDTQ